MMSELQPLTANSPEVLRELAKHGVEIGENGKPAVPVNSRQKLPETTPAPEPLKPKKIQIELDPASYARLEREAKNRQQTPRAYLTEIVNEHLKENIGRPYVQAPSNFGPKVTAPTNAFGRELKN